MNAPTKDADPKAVAGLTAVVVLPMIVAIWALREPQWFPVFDLSMTELKVRDVGSSDRPLVGLAGRIGSADQPGSHPGPLAYWLLWPVYRLTGQTSWALQLSSVVFHTVAVAMALWIAGRRGGRRLMVAMAALLAVVVAAFGAVLFTVPWNPNLPVLWWLVFLLALWSVATGDLPMLPVAVVAGSIAAQTHVPYLAMTTAVAGAVTVAVVGSVVLATRRGRPRSDDPAPTGHGTAWWAIVAASLGVVLWLPPLVDQITQDPGNARVLVDHFRSPESDPIGLVDGARVVVDRLDPIALLTLDVQVDGFTPSGSPVPGLVLLTLWVIAVVVARRERHPVLTWLHVTTGAAVVFGVVAASRIFGGVWNYLLLWTWLVGALLVVATGWSLGLAVRDRIPEADRPRAAGFATAALLVVALVWSGVGAVDAADAEVSGQMRSTQTGVVAAQTADALADRRDADRFQVTWSDPTHLGSQGWGLVLELERQGFDVVGPPPLATMLGRHRVADRDEVDGVLALAVGPAIDEWRADPAAVEVAHTDHEAERREARQALIDEVTSGLRASGSDDLADAAVRQPAAARSDPQMPPEYAQALVDASEIGYPVAVFWVDQRDGA